MNYENDKTLAKSNKLFVQEPFAGKSSSYMSVLMVKGWIYSILRESTGANPNPGHGATGPDACLLSKQQGKRNSRAARVRIGC